VHSCQPDLREQARAESWDVAVGIVISVVTTYAALLPTIAGAWRRASSEPLGS